MVTVTAWMSADVDAPAPYVEDMPVLDVRPIMSLIRFRTGAHHYRICTGRWENTPRTERLCRKCALRQVEDEKHVVFECPWYSTVRQQFHSLIDVCQGSMVQLMTHANQAKVANFLFAIEQRFFEVA